MAAKYGREVTLSWKGTLLKGVIEKSTTINGEPADITVSEDDGWRRLLTEDASKSIDWKFSGIEEDSVLRAAKLSQNISGELIVTYADGATITCQAVMSSLELGHPMEEATTFSATFMSSGVPVYVAGV